MEYEVMEFDLPSAAMKFSNPRERRESTTEKISYKGSADGRPIRNWGRANDMPQWREQVVMDNNIVPALLNSKIGLTYGTGLFPYKKEFISDDGIMNIKEVQWEMVVQEFFDKVRMDDYLWAALKNLFMHANVFTEFIRDANGHIADIRLWDCKYVRLGEQDKKGKVKFAYLCGNWPKSQLRKDGETEHDKEVIEIPMYNFDEENKQPNFMLHTGNMMLNDGYYNTPAWQGSIPWMETSNAIPLWHQANMRNGYTPRFHIRIPKDYFFTSPVSEAADAMEKAINEAATKKATFIKEVNAVLAGIENTGRAIFSDYFWSDTLASKYPGIEIEAIKADIQDKAMLELFEKSNTANISSQGIYPTLANIETQGKLSSGSEIRNAYHMFIAIQTPIPRSIILKVINLVKKINGWNKEIDFAFGDIQITTLDESPTGTKEDSAAIPDKKAEE